MKNVLRAGVCAAGAALLLSACGGGAAYKPRGHQQTTRVVRGSTRPATAPTARRANSYTVQTGDTLYAISMRFGIDWKSLARVNQLSEPYTIHPGQVLRLSASSASTPSVAATTRTAPTTSPTSSQRAVTAPTRTGTNTSQVATPPAQANAPKPTPSQPAPSNVAWTWPVKGAVVGRYAAGDPTKQGVDIAGKAGQAVKASAAGTVVYSGNGLVGLGELIIVKHNDTWISAYGHNRKRLVAEGAKVASGQTIAEMGDSGTNAVKLHFEIRKDGKPVDPLRYLPAK